MGVTPAHAFAQIDATDLAAFDGDPSFFGSLGQGIERPLGRALLISSHHGPISLCREVPWRLLPGQSEDPTALPFCQSGLTP